MKENSKQRHDASSCGNSAFPSNQGRNVTKSAIIHTRVCEKQLWKATMHRHIFLRHQYKTLLIAGYFQTE
jgi:hypothetical protein